MNIVRMLFAVRHAAEGVHIILESAVIVAVSDGELLIRRMVDRTAAVDADRIRRTMRSQTFQRSADLVIHAAVADAERRAAVSDERFVVHIVVVQRLVGNQGADIDLRAHAVDVVNRVLCTVAIASRGLAAVVLGIDDARRRLAVLDMHGHVARSERFPRTERADSSRPAEVTDRVERRFEILRADDLALLESREETLGRRILKAALVVELHVAVTAGNDLDDDIAVLRLLCGKVCCCGRIAVAAAVRRDLILQVVESRERRLLADACQKDVANFGIVELDLVLDVELNVLHEELHFVRRRIFLHVVLDVRLRLGQRPFDVLPGL